VKGGCGGVSGLVKTIPIELNKENQKVFSCVFYKIDCGIILELFGRERALSKIIDISALLIIYNRNY
jgi:hypothetical protein